MFPELKRVTKIASVLGKKFTNKVLGEIINEEEIEKYILNGVEENLWYSLSKVDNIFKNAFIRESVYQLMLKKELRHLHKLAGQSIENLFADNLEEYYADLAYNFQEAEMWEKALFYMEKAGLYAKDMYQINASINYYRNSLIILQKLKNLDNHHQLEIKFRINIVELYLLLGDTDNAQAEIEKINEDAINITEETDRFYFFKAQILSIRENYVELKDFCLSVANKISTKYYKNYLKVYYLDTLRYLNNQADFEKDSASFLLELQDEKDTFFESRLSNIIGFYHLNRAEYDKAMEFFQSNYEVIKKLNNRVLIQGALLNIGIVHARLGDKRKAMEYYKKSLKIAVEIGSKHASSILLTNIAAIYSVEGKYESALENYNKALRISHSVGNRVQEGIIIYNIGEVYYRQKFYSKALNYLEDSKNICQEVSDIIGVTYANDQMGDIYFDLKNYQDAKLIYKKNLKIQQKLKDKEGIAHTYGNLGNLAKVEKNYSQAEEYYFMQQNMLNEIGDIHGEGNAFFNWAMNEIEQGNFDKAKEKLEKALSLFNACSYKAGIDLCHQQLDKIKK
ncbi:MAG: tetratricopeptide repeat protein [Candidatus Cloacimonetes bacterium]|nr:tetratricopeptide repeat protein [Candidatus Cloacimonadota bacterium]